MNNFAIALAKVAALTSGAVLGTLLARWYDAFIASQVQEQSEYDKTRYAQGLAPISSQPWLEEKQR